MAQNASSGARAADMALGTAAASLPLWALQVQHWSIWVAAVLGGALAVCRFVQFGVEIIGKWHAKKRRRRP